MPATIPCLWFDGQAEPAARLYTEVFPNSTIDGITHYGPDTPGTEGAVLTVEFTLDGTRYIGLNGGPQFTFSEAISFQIMCADQAEVDHYWYRLSEGGYQDQCGWLKDRFGLSWQVVPTRLTELLQDPDPARANRAMQAMLTMRRIDIAALEAAADAEPA
ncbi:VOC family protein [Nakamurella multipartita]|jgi:predicted 3-demethylubiquinone-9 3-methyltransferase (glyoxalase superfamily)|uniref:3-demethylubiquinone-9 3-methyltransferase n=1 Tax=Nakamurella multipartita (strain ATCC 700099 / DSM 44233 / CIP 104796 / JCM 9543 / NBRC 105858 / Y-104) TaxID=479431 RepID=C8XC94_NAKMY|nr:VOC family protein [Nakamurella multipartita]ACV81488.1 3-demethylubiquinone-9 3-methyltransferase [Nakamurella multipartita DSM 44233]HOZ58401.1 VOC family protein [Nakamurella multipartita]